MSEDDDIARSVEQHGWHAIAIPESEHAPAFVYTIGLCRTFAHAELIVFGLDARFAHSVLSAVVNDITDGHVYVAGQASGGVLEGHDVAFRSVHPTQHFLHMGYAMAYYRRIARPELLTTLQLFWPDKAGKFPSELTCDPDVARLQPRLELVVPPSELRVFLREHGG